VKEHIITFCFFLKQKDQIGMNPTWSVTISLLGCREKTLIVANTVKPAGLFLACEVENTGALHYQYHDLI